LAISFASRVVAIPLYLYKPTEWSASIAFVGGAAQGFVIVQAMFTAREAGKEKTHTN